MTRSKCQNKSYTNKNYGRPWKSKVHAILMMQVKIKFNAESAGVMKMMLKIHLFSLVNVKVP